MQRCSALSAALGEPLAGTAPVAARWLCVEHTEPWGRDVAETTPVFAELTRRAAAAGARLELIRRPGRRTAAARTRVFVADTTPGASWLSSLDCTGPAELLDLDLAAAEPPAAATTEPLLLVCTHAQRDPCCAIAGRALATALPGAWECSHLGGHRFAPNAAVLPAGYVYGRLDPAAAADALAAVAAGQVRTEYCRGRSTWSPAGQVAELAVRELTGERSADALTVDSPDGTAAVLVAHRDGQAWQVRVEAAPLPGLRPTSCGGEATPATPLVATGPTQLSRTTAR